MASLSDVQNEVQRQLARDYGDAQPERLRMISMLGLSEEAGEVLGLEKRRLRQKPKDRQRAAREYYVEELGDVLWYLAAACSSAGTSLEEVWQNNIIKLKERYGNG